jgi:hypothetical protein
MISFEDSDDHDRADTPQTRRKEPDIDGYVERWKMTGLASEPQGIAQQILDIVKLDRFQMIARQVSTVGSATKHDDA